jgi:hypothetical protein
MDQMTQAITYAPDLSVARFQLGLMHFTSANMPAADEVWQRLAELPPEHPLNLFRSGLMHLARDEFADCLSQVRDGIGRNTEHPSLNRVMQAVLEAAETALNEQKRGGAEVNYAGAG